MVMNLLFRILVVIPVAYILACLVAGLLVLLATIGVGEDGSYLRTYPRETLLLASALAAWAGAFACIPALVAILMAEAFGWRSLLFYLLAGGAIGLGYAWTFKPPDAASASSAGPELYLAAGLVGGLVYWLLAGRSARLTIAKSESAP
jgi:hypothetical protein